MTAGPACGCDVSGLDFFSDVAAFHFNFRQFRVVIRDRFKFQFCIMFFGLIAERVIFDTHAPPFLHTRC